MYRLIAGLLSAPPGAAALGELAQLSGDDSPLGEAVATLARIAARRDPTSIAEEFHDLFIGIGRGELVPYASYYLTGFLHEKPLARLRQDMAGLGIERAPGVSEPEDHAASLLDIMAGLIDGSFGASASLLDQRSLFDRHLAGWLPHFFRDLEQAKAAVLYGALATVGRRFLEIEAAALTMD